MSTLSYDKFLIFGDSITEFSYDPYPNALAAVQFGYGAALQNVYTRRLDVVQRGYAGYNSGHAVQLISEIVRIENSGEGKIKIATVFFGTNDSVLGGVQQVPLDQYLANIRKIIEVLQINGIKAVLIGPGMHDEETWKVGREKDYEQGLIRSNENNKKYATALGELASELAVPFLNLYAEFEKYNNWKSFLCDGVHLTGEGYKILYNGIMAKIGESYPELAPENLTYKLPYWRDIRTDISLVDQ